MSVLGGRVGALFGGLGAGGGRGWLGQVGVVGRLGVVGQVGVVGRGEGLGVWGAGAGYRPVRGVADGLGGDRIGGFGAVDSAPRGLLHAHGYGSRGAADGSGEICVARIFAWPASSLRFVV